MAARRRGGIGRPGGDPDRTRERRERRLAAPRTWTRGQRLLAAGVTAVVVGLLGGYLLATLWLFPGPEAPADLVEVPDLHALAGDEAGSRLEEAGLRLGPVDSLRHPEVERGRILAQSPLPGQFWPPGEPVRVTVSLGPSQVQVPALEGMRAERAVAVLEAQGFTVAMDSVDADAPPGIVAFHTPGGGTEVTLPTEVTLGVSRGPPSLEMPRLVGLTQAEAEHLLDSLGLVLADVDEVFRFGRDQGRVVEQGPPPNTTVERGTAVRLVVGRRPRDGDPPEGGDGGAGGS